MNTCFKVLRVVGGLFYPGSTTDEEIDCRLLLSQQQNRGGLVKVGLLQRFTEIRLFFFKYMLVYVHYSIWKQ